MLTTLTIQRLRGLTNASLEGLAPVTVLVGPNGSGKTTVLEACGVVAAGSSPLDAWHAILHREWLGPEGLRFIVSAKGAVVSGLIDGQRISQSLAVPAF